MSCVCVLKRDPNNIGIAVSYFFVFHLFFCTKPASLFVIAKLFVTVNRKSHAELIVVLLGSTVQIKFVCKHIPCFEQKV